MNLCKNIIYNMKTYEEFNKLSPYKIYWCINVNEFEDSIKKIDNIYNIDNYIKSYFLQLHDVIINTTQNQNYCYLSISTEGGHQTGGWNPLINLEYNYDHHHYYGDQYYKDDKYKFGGYINCTKEEVKNYIENYEFMKKYNL